MGEPSGPESPRQNLTVSLPAAVTGILRELDAAGHPAYVVGGAVRDAVLGRTPHDYDVASDALPSEVQRLFPDSFAVGAGFGTITVRTQAGPVEVTTFRADGPYRDSRHPAAVVFGVSLRDDLARRDFTCNAMAYRPAEGLVDPFGGAADLAAHRLATVGPPAARFSEDALRMYRAVRLAVELDLRPSRAILRAIRRLHPLTNNLAAERVRIELERLLLSPHPGPGLRLLACTGLLNQLLPELAAASASTQPAALYRRLAVVGNVPPQLPLRLAALLRLLPPGTAAETILRRLTFPRTLSARVALLLHFWDHPALSTPTAEAIRRLAATIGVPVLADLAALRTATSTAPPGLGKMVSDLCAAPPPLHLSDLALDGTALMKELSLSPSPAVGALLAELLDAVLADPAHNTPEFLLTLAQAHQTHQRETLLPSLHIGENRSGRRDEHGARQ